jgi:hypothetical protein
MWSVFKSGIVSLQKKKIVEKEEELSKIRCRLFYCFVPLSPFYWTLNFSNPSYLHFFFQIFGRKKFYLKTIFRLRFGQLGFNKLQKQIMQLNWYAICNNSVMFSSSSDVSDGFPAKNLLFELKNVFYLCRPCNLFLFLTF